MSQTSASNPNNLPGIVTDQPEIYESEQAFSDDTGINDLDSMDANPDDAVTLIEVPTRQAFAYFAERENEIAQFYVQRYGEYKNHSDVPEEETDIEKYHRLVSEVNQLLSKFQNTRASTSGPDSLSTKTTSLTNNLELLCKQLKTLEFAAEDGTLDPSQSGFVHFKAKLDKLRKDIDEKNTQQVSTDSDVNHSEKSKIIHMSALEQRLNNLELLLGKDEEKLQNLLRATKSESLIDASASLSTWLSIFQQDNVSSLNAEIDLIGQRLDKLNEQSASASEETTKRLDAQAKGKLEQLYNLVTATDKQRAMVPTILHRLNAMEELHQKASNVATTLNYLEQVQSQIEDSLQANKGEISSLTEMFSKNIELIKQFSKDIDARILSIRKRED